MAYLDALSRDPSNRLYWTQIIAPMRSDFTKLNSTVELAPEVFHLWGRFEACLWFPWFPPNRKSYFIHPSLNQSLRRHLTGLNARQFKHIFENAPLLIITLIFYLRDIFIITPLLALKILNYCRNSPQLEEYPFWKTILKADLQASLSLKSLPEFYGLRIMHHYDNLVELSIFICSRINYRYG